jgi:hypothetical protein
MNSNRPFSAPRDVDLERTRRTFLFAREQVASQMCSGRGYSAAAADTRHRTARRDQPTAHPVTETPDRDAR